MTFRQLGVWTMIGFSSKFSKWKSINILHCLLSIPSLYLCGCRLWRFRKFKPRAACADSKQYSRIFRDEPRCPSYHKGLHSPSWKTCLVFVAQFDDVLSSNREASWKCSCIRLSFPWCVARYDCHPVRWCWLLFCASLQSCYSLQVRNVCLFPCVSFISPNRSLVGLYSHWKWRSCSIQLDSLSAPYQHTVFQEMVP